MAGKVCIVTGGTRGFGAAIVSLFVSQGAKVLVLDLLASDGAYDPFAISPIPPSSPPHPAPQHSTYALKADITQRADWARALSRCIEIYGSPPTVVVNNAGWTYSNKPTLEVTEDEFERVFTVNVKSVFLSVEVVLRELLESSGGVRDASWINVSSTAALRPRPGLVWCKFTTSQRQHLGPVLSRRKKKAKAQIRRRT